MWRRANLGQQSSLRADECHAQDVVRRPLSWRLLFSERDTKGPSGWSLWRLLHDRAIFDVVQVVYEDRGQRTTGRKSETRRQEDVTSTLSRLYASHQDDPGQQLLRLVDLGGCLLWILSYGVRVLGFQVGRMGAAVRDPARFPCPLALWSGFRGRAGLLFCLGFVAGLAI